MLSRQGGLQDRSVTERLQVQSKPKPPFFAPEQSEVKPIIHEKVQTTQQELYFCENGFT